MKKTLLALLAALFFSVPAWAAPLPGGDSDLPVDVTADTMEYSADKNSVTFHGNVVAVRGEFTMWSEKLTLILKGKDDKSEKENRGKNSSTANSAGNLDRVIAEKNVRFKNGAQHGTSEKATYFAKTNILVLEGSPILHDGENSIRGNVIRYFLNENRSVVEGSAQRRVHAIFSNEKKDK